MPTTAVTPLALPSKYPTLPVTALSLDVTTVAADVANGNHFLAQDGDVLYWMNGGVTGRTVSITSVADDKGRTGDITTYAVAAGKIGRFPISGNGGWISSLGKVLMSGSHADIVFWIDRR